MLIEREFGYRVWKAKDLYAEDPVLFYINNSYFLATEDLWTQDSNHFY